MVPRLVTIPLSSDNFTKELDIIKQIALFNNGYDPQLVDEIIDRKVSILLYNRSILKSETSTLNSTAYRTLIHQFKN